MTSQSVGFDQNVKTKQIYAQALYNSVYNGDDLKNKIYQDVVDI